MNEALSAALRFDIQEEAAHILEGVVQEGMDYHTPADGYVLPPGYVMRTHPQSRCKGDICSVHNPSDHPLRDAPRYWRADRGLMERLCEHEVGHPDPDDIAFTRRTYGDTAADVRATHTCCPEGCCGTVARCIDGEVVSERKELER